MPLSKEKKRDRVQVARFRAQLKNASRKRRNNDRHIERRQNTLDRRKLQKEVIEVEKATAFDFRDISPFAFLRPLVVASSRTAPKVIDLKESQEPIYEADTSNWLALI